MVPALWLVQAGIAAVATYYYYDENIKSLKGEIDLYKLKFDLNIHIFGQTEALNGLMNSLTRKPTKNRAEAIVLYGGVGVGKTLALSLIRQHYTPSKTIISLQQQNLDDVAQRSEIQAQLMNRLARVTSGVALVTVDNADISSVELWSFIKDVDQLCQLKQVTAQVVIGAQLFRDTTSENVRSMISNSFKNEEDYLDYIKDKNKNVCSFYSNCRAIMFKPVSLDTLKMCINASAKSLTRMELTDKQMDYLMDQIADVGLDYVPGGCKSVDNYVALLHDSM